MKKKNNIPPKLAQRLLLRFLRDDLAEEVLGDLEEKFYSTLQTKSLFRARINYWHQVFNYLRPFAIRKSKPMHSNHYAMYQSYFKIGWRNLLKNKGYSFINIGGLAVGLACCILIGLYTWDEYNYDRFHRHFENIYRVTEQQIQAEDLYTVAVTPGPLAGALKADFPEIEQTCRIGRVWSNGILQVGKLSIEPNEILVTDNSFFRLFDFKLVQGNSQKALLGPDDVVITESIAAKVFGSEWQHSNTLLGQQILYNNERVLTLAGVIQDPPRNSHIQYDVLLSFRFDETNTRHYNWNSNNYHTYILVNPDADANALDTKLNKHLTKYSPETTTTLSLQRLSDIYLFSKFDFHTDWSKTSDVVYIKVFLAVGLIVLFIAIFNFINLSTARAMSRAKEVGVRKVIGAVHKQLIAQFLSESLIMAFLSICLALIILQFFLPLLNNISGKSIYVPFHDVYFISAILGLTLVVGVMAGIYPAFYLSNFKPAKALKGFFTVKSGQVFRRTLVVGQFTFSVMLVIGTMVIYKQLIYLQNKNLGFDRSQLLYVNLKNDLREKASLFKADLEQQTNIAGVAATSTNLVDVMNSTGAIKWEGQEAEDNFLMTQINIDEDFLAATRMELVAGRNFDPAITSDTVSAYLINETAAKRMGWTPEEALGKSLTLWQFPGTVIGVVRDFHFRPMTTAIEPFLFHYWPRESPSGMFVKLQANQVPEAISTIEKFYKKYESKTAPQYQFVNDVLENQYRTEQNTGRIILHFSILAILISCLGLFGLATYSAEQRTKEIGVRKVLGASVSSIVNLLSKDFLRLVLIAILIASPIAWWSMNKWLQDFAYKITLEWWIFGLSGLGAIIIAFLTVSIQSIKTAMLNPVKSLRSD